MLGTSEKGLELVGGVCKTGAAIAYLKKKINKELWLVFVCKEILDEVRNIHKFMSRVITEVEIRVYSKNPETREQTCQRKSPPSACFKGKLGQKQRAC